MVEKKNVDKGNLNGPDDGIQIKSKLDMEKNS